MHCPQCGNPIASRVLADGEAEIACQVCGSSLRIEAAATVLVDPQQTSADGAPQPFPDARPPALAAPRRLGRFQLQECLGTGGFGTVFKAHDPDLSRSVALKVPHLSRLGTPEDRRRFLEEARHLARVRHGGIVSVHEVGEEDGVPFLVTDFLQGTTLSQRLVERRPSFEEAAGLCASVADALQHAHTAGIVHRDVKPGNIMLDHAGQPYLMDFGLAKQESTGISMSATGEVLGTPAYMSPEQAAGDVHSVDARSDVYSLGVVLYELLTGERPFRGNNHMLIQQVLNEEPRPLRLLNDRVPRDLETVCLKAMHKEPRHRYASAGEFAEDLRRYMRREPVMARPVGVLARFWLWCRRPERIRDASIITVSMTLMLALWEFQGLVFIATGMMQVSRPLSAVGIVTFGMLFFSTLAGLGWLARSRTLAALWLGGAAAIGLLGFSILCLVGVIPIEGLTDNAARVPVFGFFSIAAAFTTGAHAISLLAFYSNRSTMRWSKHLPSDGRGAH